MRGSGPENKIFTRRTLQANDVVRDVLQTRSEPLLRKNISLAVDLAGPFLRCTRFTQEMEQVIINLIPECYVDAMPNGGALRVRRQRETAKRPSG